MTGKLYGIGVGPGDPELLTLKAFRLISNAKTIAYPAPDHGQSFARQIVADAIRPDAVEIPIVIPMRIKRFPAQAIYNQAAEQIGALLHAGNDVVVLCEGDPFFYGSFMYIFMRLNGSFPIEIVPGVSSLSAVSASSQTPLCARNDVISVIPAPLPAKTIRARLRTANAAAIIKIGRHMEKLRNIIDELGLTARANFVAHASLPQEQAVPLSEAPKTAPYFSMILIQGNVNYA